MTSSSDTRRASLFAYDSAGRKLEQKTREISGANPSATPISGRDAGVQRTEYSLNGWPLKSIGRQNESITRSFTAVGQLSQVTDSANQSSVSADYFLNGWQRTATTTVNEAPTYSSRTTAFKYAADGLQTAHLLTTNSDGSGVEQTTSYTYNDARALTGVASNGWTRTNDTWTIRYDNAARPAEMTDAQGRLTTYARNGDGTLQNKTLYEGATSTSSILDKWSYTYDGLNRVASRTRTGQAGAVSESFHYDKASRLDKIDAATIGLDPNGNRTSANGVSWRYRSDNSIASENGADYVEAPFGGTDSDLCRSYTYDGFDRLTVSAKKTGSNCTAAGASDRIDYDYDGLDRQTRTITTPTSGSAKENVIRYVGTATDVYTEEADTSSTTARYTSTPDGQPLSVISANAVPVWNVLASDGQGTITLATTSSGGGIGCTVNLDIWGSARGAVNSSDNPCTTGISPNNRWYNGAKRTDGTGNYALGNRTYRPETASWLEPDNSRGASAPSDLSIGTDPLLANRYNYVNGDPINLSDPTGHSGCPDGLCTQAQMQAEDQRNARNNLVGMMDADMNSNFKGGTPDWWYSLPFEQKLDIWMSNRLSNLGLLPKNHGWKSMDLNAKVDYFNGLGDKALEGPGCSSNGISTLWGVGKYICEHPKGAAAAVKALTVVATVSGLAAGGIGVVQLGATASTLGIGVAGRSFATNALIGATVSSGLEYALTGKVKLDTTIKMAVFAGFTGPVNVRSGAVLAEEAAADVITNLHHTVPREILKELPEEVANNALVRGRAGAPNRWAIPETLHKLIHQGPGGGAYNQAWKDALGALGRTPTVEDVLALRTQITKQFGIDGYRPGL